MTQTIIRVAHLTIRYGETLALDDVSFQIEAGDSVAIIGPNGAGKSTLMQALMGLIQTPPSCDMSIMGGRESLGYVAQHQEVAWDFPITVYDAVMMGLARQIGWLRWAQRTHRQRVMEALERVGLEKLANRQIGELSGGQKRRVLMARALAQSAQVLLLDEPFAGVDVGAQAGLMDVIEALNGDGMTILLSTHDLALAFKRFKRVMALNQRMIGMGVARELYTPQVLTALYGGGLATWQDGHQVTIVVDEHGCC